MSKQPLDLSCRCRGCGLSFYINDLDSFVRNSSETGFPISDLVCPRCKQKKIDVNIVIREGFVRTEDEPDLLEGMQEKLEDMFKQYSANPSDKMAKKRLAISLINMTTDLSKALQSSLQE